MKSEIVLLIHHELNALAEKVHEAHGEPLQSNPMHPTLLTELDTSGRIW